MNDIEAIARAICEAHIEPCTHICPMGAKDDEQCPAETVLECWDVEARAALQCIIERWREPGEEALNIGQEASARAFCDTLTIPPEEIKFIWQAMLSEKAKEVDE